MSTCTYGVEIFIYFPRAGLCVLCVLSSKSLCHLFVWFCGANQKNTNICKHNSHTRTIMCTCTCTRTHTYNHTHTPNDTHTDIHTRTRIRTNTHTYIRISCCSPIGAEQGYKPCKIRAVRAKHAYLGCGKVQNPTKHFWKLGCRISVVR